jgi:hypothetical protein
VRWYWFVRLRAKRRVLRGARCLELFGITGVGVRGRRISGVAAAEYGDRE